MAKTSATEVAHLLKMVVMGLDDIDPGESDFQEAVKSFCVSVHALARVTLNEQDLKELGIRATALVWDRRLTLDEAIEGWKIRETPQGSYIKVLNDPQLDRVLRGE